MSKKHLILGWVKKNPSHGYLIKKHYQDFINPSDSLNDAQLYPLLREMEEEGLITRELESEGSGPARKTISITAKGESEFEEWLASDSGETSSSRPRYDFFRAFPFLTKFSFFYELDRKTVTGKIDLQIELHRDKLDDFSRARESMIAKGLETTKIQAIEFGIMLEETILNWLREMADYYGQAQGASKADGPTRKSTRKKQGAVTVKR
jgi:DNA-binding PadR family transcriptional regulator